MGGLPTKLHQQMPKLSLLYMHYIYISRLGIMVYTYNGGYLYILIKTLLHIMTRSSGACLLLVVFGFFGLVFFMVVCGYINRFWSP